MGRSNVLNALILAPLFFQAALCGAQSAEPVEPAPGPTLTPEESALVQQLTAAFPQDCKVVLSERNSIPPNWRTSDGGGLRISINTGRTFDVWFMPADWIGIRHSGQHQEYLRIPEEILTNAQYKAIAPDGETYITGVLGRQLSFCTASIVNSGWGWAEKAFEGKLEDADRRAKALVEEFCKDQDALNEAAYSLVLLGVPARSVFIECALKGRGEAQSFSASALGYLGGKDAVKSLSEVLLDPRSSDDVQMHAAASLYRLADPSSGPVLLKALNQVKFRDALTYAARAVECIRYRPAAPRLLELMEREDERSSDWGVYAKVLASLRYQQAIPAIEKRCKIKPLTAEAVMKLRETTSLGYTAEIALLRLTGPWGKPVGGVRLLLLGPAKAELGKPMLAVVLVENSRNEQLDVLELFSGSSRSSARLPWPLNRIAELFKPRPMELLVDGQAHQMAPAVYDGPSGIPPNEVWVLSSFDLARFIATPGKHRVQFRAAHATSNVITLEVLQRERGTLPGFPGR